MQQLQEIREISYVREAELRELREFAAMEQEAIVSSSSSSSSSKGGSVEVGCQSDEDAQAEQGTQTHADEAVDKENRTEVARLRAELAASKGGYELLKLTALQEYATKPGSDRRQLMAAASRVVSIIDAGI